MQAQESPSLGHRPSSLIWATLLITLGAILLLNNIGLLPWTIWDTLARLWPIVLIALGAEILLGRTQPAAGALAAAFLVLVVAAVTFAYVVVPSTFQPAFGVPTFHQETISVPLQSSQSGDVSIGVGVAQVNLSAAPSTSSDLVQVIATLPPGSRIEQSRTVVGDTARASLVERTNQGVNIPFSRPNNAGDFIWDVRVTPRVPVSLSADLGVGQSNLDLSNLNVTDLRVSAGVGETTITLPARAEQTNGSISGGVGHLTLIVPANVGARISTSSGLGAVNASSRFVKTGSTYQTDNYSSAASRVNLSLNLGVGSVDLR